MAERCPDCNVYMRKVKHPETGEGWLCTNCGIDDPILEKTKEVLEELERTRGETGALAFALAQDVAGEVGDNLDDETVAAGCVYLASIMAGDKLNQPHVGEAAGVGQVTVRKHYKDIYEASGWEEHFGPIERGELAEEETPHDSIDLDGWAEHTRDRNSDAAAKASLSDLRRFAVWYDGDGDPDAEDVSAWLAHLASEGYAPATLERRYGTLRQYFAWAGLGELDKENVDFEEHHMAAWRERVEA